MNQKKNLLHQMILLTLCLLFTGCSARSQQSSIPSAKEMLSSEAEASSDIEASSDTGASSGTEPSPSPKAASAALKTSSSAKSHSSAKAPVKTTITISAAGDCTFGSDKSSPSSVNFYAVYNKVKKPSYFFQNVKKYFSKDDLTIVNLEGTLTKSQNRMDKTYAFRGNPSYVNILKKGSIEAVSFANNHCRDYGEQSYTDTIRTLKKAGIKYASYSTVSVYKTKGKKIGMIAVNGLFGLDYSKKLIASGMKKLKKKKADLIIVSMHAGTEHTNVLTSLQKQLAHYAVQKGANLVLGHHPHTLQGIEKYKGAYIVYSLANFCFGGNTNPVDKDTMIFQQTFTFSDDTLQKTNDIRIIPCSVSSKTTINNYQPTPLKGKKKQAVIKKLNTFSKSLGVQFKKNGTVK